MVQKDAYGKIVGAVKNQAGYKPSVPLQIISEEPSKQK